MSAKYVYLALNVREVRIFGTEMSRFESPNLEHRYRNVSIAGLVVLEDIVKERHHLLLV